MTSILLAAPAVEPVSLAEAKAWLRIDDAASDAPISALIVSARMTLEARTRRYFITQGWRLIYDAWPTRAGPGAGETMSVPFAPFQGVTAMRVYDAAEAAQTLPATSYRAPAAPNVGRIGFLSAPPAPGRARDGIEIDILAGYGPAAADVPEPLRRAMLMLVAHWHENRGDDEAKAPPQSVAALIAPFVRERLR